MSFRRITHAALPLMVAVGAIAGERAQTSGARRPEGEETRKTEIPTPEAEAQRVTVLDKLLRNRRFDVLRSGNSLGGAIDIPAPTGPAQSGPMLDPKAQKRILEELERRKNWLVEPGSTTPRGLDKPTDPSKETPDFSRDRGRNRVRTRQEVANDTAAAGEAGDDAEGLAGRKPARKGQADGASEDRSAADGARGDDASLDETRLKPLLDGGREPGSGSWDHVRSSPERGGKQEGLFQFGPIGGGRASSLVGGDASGSASPLTGTGAAAAVQSFIDPNADPSSERFSGSGRTEPNSAFDPTVAPSLSFVPRDDMSSSRAESFSGGAASAGAPVGGGFGTGLAAPATGFGTPAVGGFGPSVPSAGSGTFNPFGAASSAASGLNSFLSPGAGADPLPALKAPAFTPRPAVLIIEPPKPF